MIMCNYNVLAKSNTFLIPLDLDAMIITMSSKSMSELLMKKYGGEISGEQLGDEAFNALILDLVSATDNIDLRTFLSELSVKLSDRAKAEKLSKYFLARLMGIVDITEGITLMEKSGELVRIDRAISNVFGGMVINRVCELTKEWAKLDSSGIRDRAKNIVPLVG